MGECICIERFFDRVLIFFRLQRPPVFGWSAKEMCVALTYAIVCAIALATQLGLGPCLGWDGDVKRLYTYFLSSFTYSTGRGYDGPHHGAQRDECQQDWEHEFGTYNRTREV